MGAATGTSFQPNEGEYRQIPVSASDQPGQSDTDADDLVQAYAGGAGGVLHRRAQRIENGGGCHCGRGQVDHVGVDHQRAGQSGPPR